MENNRIGRGGQIRVYLGKCFRLFASEKHWVNFVSTAIIMVIILLVTGTDMFVDYTATINGANSIISACIWIGLFNSIRSICKERAIIKREYRTGLHISSYILAHVVYELAICAAESLLVVLSVAIRYFENMPFDGLIFPMAVDLYITFLLVTFGSDMLAILISSIVRSENTAMTVMPFVLIIQLVMSGTVYTLSGAAERVSYLTLSKWGMNAFCTIANTVESVYWGYYWYGQGDCDNTVGNLLFRWLWLIFFAILYILLSIVALKQVDRDER